MGAPNDFQKDVIVEMPAPRFKLPAGFDEIEAALVNVGLEVTLDSSHEETKERLWMVTGDGSLVGTLLEQSEEDHTCVMVGAESKHNYHLLRAQLIAIGAEDLSDAYYMDPVRRGIFFRIGRWLYRRRFGWNDK